jgi:hypothetical protein
MMSAACADQAAPERRIRDDLRVVGRAGGCGNVVDQVPQVEGATDLVQQARPAQRIDGGDDVDRLAVTEEPANGGVDLAVRGPIEVLGVEDLDHVGHGFGRQEHGPQHRPFRFEVLRREAMAGRDADDLFSRACHPWTPPFRTPTPTDAGGYAQ